MSATVMYCAGDVRVENLFGGGASVANIFDLDGAVVKVFIETLLPPVPLVVFGAGHDALPVVELACGLGWRTEVVDPQARPATRSRFVAADRITLARPEEVAAQVSITPRTLALLMSHNYSHDLSLLGFLLASPARYTRSPSASRSLTSPMKLNASSRARNACGISGRAVAADDLHPGMSLEPGAQGRGLPIRQQIDDKMLL
jgi:hypothetical protein